jgi:hypothetical protein
MCIAEARRIGAEIPQVRLDTHAQVDPGQAHEFQKAFEVMLWIAFAIDGDDRAAAPTQEFIDTQVFDVAAVGDVHAGGARSCGR